MVTLSFISDLFKYTYVQRALLTSIFIGLVTGVLGSFIILSGKSLMGEAISHAILPGVVISYIFGINYFYGAILFGLFATYLMTKISEKSKLNSDVSIGIVFTSFFALGTLLLIKVGTATDLEQILFGNVLTITNESMYITLIVGTIVLILITVFFKAFLITIFDPIIGKTYGFNIKFFEHLLMVLLTFVIVSSLQAVGVILVVAMLITPAASAYFWTDNFKKMIFISSTLSVISSILGIYLSFTFDLSSGPTIVLVLAFVFLLSYLFGKESGLLIKKFKKGTIKNEKTY